jgi:hypothetical protein
MLIKIAIGFLAAFLGLFSACTAVILQAGVGSVYVSNDDVTLWLPVPMAAVDIGLWFIPEKELEDVQESMLPVKDLMLAGFHELQDIPDTTLVEVKTPDESVLVLKEGNDLVVDVDSRSDGKVHVKLPLHSLERILRIVSG